MMPDFVLFHFDFFHVLLRLEPLHAKKNQRAKSNASEKYFTHQHERSTSKTTKKNNEQFNSKKNYGSRNNDNWSSRRVDGRPDRA